MWPNREARTNTRESRILFITKLIHPFEQKKYLFGPDEHISIFFFSLGPLFIRDRLKNWTCKLVHFGEFFSQRVLWYFLWSFSSRLLSEENPHPQSLRSRENIFMHTYFHFSLACTYGVSLSFTNFTCFSCDFSSTEFSKYSEERISKNYHLALDTLIRH